MSKFIMLVGIVASGKSTYAKELSIKENAIIHSSDLLREELFGNINEIDRNEELFKELHKRIKNDLSENKNVIYDATNLNYKKRKAFLDELKKYNVYKKCYLIATPYEECLKQNSLRDRKVPEHVIKTMYKNITIPQWYEGWDDIEIVFNSNNQYNKDSVAILFNDLDKINQDNPHHTLTIGNHCFNCMEHLVSNINKENYLPEELLIAALLHDIGKKFTKEFKNAKGEDSEIAHYYNHHNVSAYLCLFYCSYMAQTKILKIANYIQWHMQPFFINSDKSKNKFIKLVGQEFYNNLLLLHEADKKAK